LRQALETPYTEMTAEELTALYADADRLGEDMLRETVTAYERLHGEHMRKEMAKVLVGKYRAKGYELIPLTDEDRAVSPLDRITVRLENTETLERLELRLNSVTDESGHISMEINIVDHTVYEGSFDEIERQREQKRLEDIAALRETELARDLPMRQRCEDPGVSMKEDI
ncbi:MAG: hypothetical protein IKR73_05465, partial [Oscillospiraceae bacterium]|nr:hypothetical protein [Oscillospiraceae bacterium]